MTGSFTTKRLLPVYIIFGLLILAGLAWVTSTRLTGSAGATSHDQDGVYRYAVKLVCVPDLGPARPALVNGRYKTAVNLLNASTTGGARPIEWCKSTSSC